MKVISMIKSFIFWQRWLFYSSLLFALFGIVIAIYGNNFFFMPYNKALAHIFGFGENIPTELELFKAFIWGPLGGTIACCYILLAFIAWFPFRKKERWAQNAIIVARSMVIIGFGCLCLLWCLFSDIYN